MTKLSEFIQNSSPIGFTGSQGAGFTGSRGETGFTGSKGDLGFTGSQGAGFTGSRGETGFTGSKGDLGFTGSQGAGFTGSAGATGFTGSTVTGMPQSTNTTVVASDSGKHLNVSAGVTINSSTGFAVGDAVSIYNNSAGNITITATGITLYNAGTSLTGNRTLAQRGIAMVLCVASNTYVISGGGVS
jgi:collagen type VII alpha